MRRRVARVCRALGRHANLRGLCRAGYRRHSTRRLVLGIETSCDDTCAAVVSSEGEVLSDARSSQDSLRRKYGGVVPNLAQIVHRTAINGVVERAMADARVEPEDLAAVAVTVGPGLAPCLFVGIRHARRISAQWGLPCIPVHHMEGHALATQLRSPGTPALHELSFPFLVLLVSGGHSLLLHAHGVGDYTELGSSLDVSMGVSFDKVARQLGLKGGGPELEAVAARGNPKAHPLSIPMRGQKHHCDFSFSGLTTQTLQAIEMAQKPHEIDSYFEDMGALPSATQADIAAAFQSAAVKHVVDRTEIALNWALEDAPDTKTLVVSGGVASNKTVRGGLERIARSYRIGTVFPPASLCTDNAAMIAWAGIAHMDGKHVDLEPPTLAEAVLRGDEEEFVQAYPRWPLGVRHPNAKKLDLERFGEHTVAKSRITRRNHRRSLTEETRERQASGCIN